MTNHYTDVCEATIKSLRQQLDIKDAEIERLLESHDARICIEAALILRSKGYIHLAEKLLAQAAQHQEKVVP